VCCSFGPKLLAQERKAHMDRTRIREVVVSIISGELSIGSPREICDASRLHEDLGFDSLDEAQFWEELDDVFGINIPVEKRTEIKTVGDAINVVNCLLRLPS
jgi:acyl carrier protein